MSTDEQNPDLQRRAINGYAATKAATIQQLYEDLGVSGALEQRPSLDALWRDAHRGLFDVVVVWKFDRLSRSTLQLLEAMQTFRDLKIEIVAKEMALLTAPASTALSDLPPCHPRSRRGFLQIATALPARNCQSMSHPTPTDAPSASVRRRQMPQSDAPKSEHDPYRSVGMR